jgi:hypothetical protein
MRRVIDFYRLQIKVMREWQPTGTSRTRRLLATLVISMLSFAGAVILTPGFDLAPGAPIIGTLLVAALCLAVLNSCGRCSSPVRRGPSSPWCRRRQVSRSGVRSGHDHREWILSRWSRRCLRLVDTILVAVFSISGGDSPRS